MMDKTREKAVPSRVIVAGPLPICLTFLHLISSTGLNFPMVQSK